MKTIPLEKLMKDSIALHKGDMLLCNSNNRTYRLDNPSWEGEKVLDWYNKVKDDPDNCFEDYSLVSFAERDNETGEQPVPDGVLVVLDDVYLMKAEQVDWDLGEWKELKVDTWWKPDFDYLYNHYNKAPESDSKEQKEESDTMNKLSGEKSSDEVSDAPVYTKEMYDQGILPEVGTVVYYKSFSGILGTTLKKIKINRTSGKVTLCTERDYGSVNLYFEDLVFPEPEKTFEEKVVDKMESFFENTFGCFDEGVVMNTYRVFKDAEKELQND